MVPTQARRAWKGAREMVEHEAGGEAGRHHLVPVEITVDDKTRTVEVRGGPTVVSELKKELGVPDEDTLFETKPRKRPLGDHEEIDVLPHQAFEAIHGGGVS